MRVERKVATAGVLAVVMLFGLSLASPAQTKRIISITMSSYKFEPNLIFVNEGDTVILQLENTDAERPHSLNSPYLSTVDFTVRGQFEQGVAKDGTKFVLVEPGNKAEIEFVAKGRGQWGFVCSLRNHAALGQTGTIVVWPAGYHPTVKQ